MDLLVAGCQPVMHASSLAIQPHLRREMLISSQVSWVQYSLMVTHLARLAVPESAHQNHLRSPVHSLVKPTSVQVMPLLKNPLWYFATIKKTKKVNIQKPPLVFHPFTPPPFCSLRGSLIDEFNIFWLII